MFLEQVYEALVPVVDLVHEYLIQRDIYHWWRFHLQSILSRLVTFFHFFKFEFALELNIRINIQFKYKLIFIDFDFLRFKNQKTQMFEGFYETQAF